MRPPHPLPLKTLRCDLSREGSSWDLSRPSARHGVRPDGLRSGCGVREGWQALATRLEALQRRLLEGAGNMH
jgi:hypothetical protein